MVRIGSAVVVMSLFATAGCGIGAKDPITYLDPTSSLAAVVAVTPQLREDVRKALGDGAGLFRSDADRRRYAEHVAAPLANRYISARMPFVDDQTRSELMAVVAERVMETVASGDDCMRPIEGRDNSMVSGIGDHRMKPILVDIATRPTVANPTVASSDQIRVAIDANLPEMARRSGLDAQRMRSLLDGGSPASVEERCRMFAGVIGTFAALPPGTGAPMLRAFDNGVREEPAQE